MAGDTLDLEAVPAFHLTKEKQIDASYPFFSDAFIGRLVPLLEDTAENAEYIERLYEMYGETATGAATLGLSSRIRRKEDTTFCSMECSNGTSDLLFAPEPFTDINEFLKVAERAWTPRDPNTDPDRIWEYRYDWLSRFVFPAGPNGDVPYQWFLKQSQSEEMQYCSKMLLFRLTPSEASTKHSFDFAKVFPKTHANLTSGKFRWFKYNKGVLRVLVGRGVGHDGRGLSPGQVLRKWERKFQSFHELLCAVEASWVLKGTDIQAKTILADFDSDLGPSNP